MNLEELREREKLAEKIKKIFQKNFSKFQDDTIINVLIAKEVAEESEYGTNKIDMIKNLTKINFNISFTPIINDIINLIEEEKGASA